MLRGKVGVRLLGSLGLLAGLLDGACSTPHGADAKRTWACFESDSCSCEVVRPNVVMGGPEVEQCFEQTCCLLTQANPSDSGATCECLVSADCAGEAKTRRSTEVVSQCPPPGEGPKPNTMCAAQGENCRQQYLQQNELSGCCAGAICKPNATAVPVCQAATASELDYAQQCARAERGDELYDLTLVTKTLPSSVGELTLPEVQFAFLGVGPNGCLNSLDLTLGAALDCKLSLEADLSGDRMRLTRINGSLEGCDGFTGASGFLSGSDLLGDVTFDTVACDAHLIFEAYCVGGQFDFVLDGTFGEVTFEAAHLTLAGGICFGEPMGECPSE